ncbi:hypothetical protein B0W44_15355 [Novibacillus thermophilus]|uniref:Uncharacterized protein n=1 Tax=Novibacillus thermophilus TaxID=1471761 RepID=A0A1U9KA20_9BACL|nr:hypothetical protein B0W44_15355 [Novibacillus thermophilus]
MKLSDSGSIPLRQDLPYFIRETLIPKKTYNGLKRMQGSVKILRRSVAHEAEKGRAQNEANELVGPAINCDVRVYPILRFVWKPK